MNAQLPLALTSSLDDALLAAFKISGDRIPRQLWDRFQTHLADDMRRRTMRERAENLKRTGPIEHRKFPNQMTPQDRAILMEGRRNAILAFLAQGPATTEQIMDAIAAEHPASRQALGVFLTNMNEKGLVTARYNSIKGRRCALWSKK